MNEQQIHERIVGQPLVFREGANHVCVTVSPEGVVTVPGCDCADLPERVLFALRIARQKREDAQ